MWDVVPSSQPCPVCSLPGMGPGEPEPHDRPIIPAKIHARGRQTPLQSASQRFQRAAFQPVQEHIAADKDVLAVEAFGVAHGYDACPPGWIGTGRSFRFFG
jgi:hypothetical protein